MKVIGIPCYYYPTTLLLVDDDEKYLNILKDSVEPTHLIFTQPLDAIDFLKTARFNSFKQDSLFSQNTLSNIESCRQDPTRLHNISVVVVDYQMPGMSGIEFCKAIRHHPCKIIMLTGEATQALAVEAFNNLIIDRFIEKSTPQLHRILSKTIEDMQFKHFQDLSIYTLNHFLKEQKPLPWFLQNEDFCTFFKTILKKYQIIEYYLLNEVGDFIMTTATNQTRYFMVRNEASFQKMLKLEIEPAYFDDPTPEATLRYESIQAKTYTPLLCNQADSLEFMDWPLHRLHAEVCDEDAFYYAIT